MILQQEIARLLRDHQGEAYLVASGKVLRDIVADYPDCSQDAVKAEVLAAIRDRPD